MSNQTQQDASDVSLVCPYCAEPDFDLVGLKSHLLCDCEVFENTEDIRSRRVAHRIYTETQRLMNESANRQVQTKQEDS
jgi:hypothetical protein